MAMPQQYRGEARQLRDAIADDHRETILEIARLYERLADDIEKIQRMPRPRSV
jgi:hypothetical protein